MKTAMKHKLLSTLPLLCALLLGACANQNPPSSPDEHFVLPDIPAEPLPTSGIPYPQLNEQTQIDHLSLQVARLEREFNTLQTRVQKIEQRSPRVQTTKTTAAPTQRLNDAKLKSRYLAGSGNAVSDTDTVAQNETRLYNQALKHYRNGNYAAAAAVLKEADGGNGSEAARRNMYLLLQSQLRLGNCESVIDIGRRYANRFRNSAEAPDALYIIGQCQFRMQQKDIARRTWRSLIQSHPNSQAAKRAAESIKQR